MAPGSFSPVFRLLVRFARNETELGLANSATGILRDLFLLLLAPTQVPFPERLAEARAAFQSEDGETRALLVAAVSSALRVHETAGRRPDADRSSFLPRVRRTELRSHREAALAFVRAALDDPHRATKTAARRALLEHLRSLLADGFTDEILPPVVALAGDPTELAGVRDALEAALAHDGARLPATQVEKLRAALDALPADLVARIRSGVGLEPEPTPETQAALRRFGPTSALAKQLGGRWLSGTFSGGFETWLEAKASAARAWADDPNLDGPFRAWARCLEADARNDLERLEADTRQRAELQSRDEDR